MKPMNKTYAKRHPLTIFWNTAYICYTIVMSNISAHSRQEVDPSITFEDSCGEGGGRGWYNWCHSPLAQPFPHPACGQSVCLALLLMQAAVNYQCSLINQMPTCVSAGIRFHWNPPPLCLLLSAWGLTPSPLSVDVLYGWPHAHDCRPWTVTSWLRGRGGCCFLPILNVGLLENFQKIFLLENFHPEIKMWSWITPILGKLGAKLNFGVTHNLLCWKCVAVCQKIANYCPT